MKQYGQGILVTSQTLTRAGVVRFEIPVTGIITGLRIALDPGAALLAADSIFDANLNGATLFPDQTQRPRIVAGQRVGLASLNAACTVGQVFTLDIDTPAGGGTGAPIYVTLTIEDGIGARGTVTIVTGSLANGERANVTALLGKSFILYRVTTDKAARVEVYSRAAYRTADASRAVGVLPSGEHGVILDVLTEGADLVKELAPAPVGVLLDTGVGGVILPDASIAITNASGVAGAVTVTFERLLLEG